MTDLLTDLAVWILNRRKFKKVYKYESGQTKYIIFSKNKIKFVLELPGCHWSSYTDLTKIGTEKDGFKYYSNKLQLLLNAIRYN